MSSRALSSIEGLEIVIERSVVESVGAPAFSLATSPSGKSLSAPRTASTVTARVDG
jgi:hypothetical protein